MNTDTACRRAQVAMLVVPLALSACAGYARRGAGAPSSAPPVKYGEGLGEVKDPIKEAKKATGILQVRVLDDRNRPLQGAYVRYSGPQKGKAATDAQGVARAVVRPGTYEIDLAPCGATVVTQTQQTAAATVTPGTATPIDRPLAGIKWERRFRPTASVKMSSPAPWKIGERVRLSVRIEDGCDFSTSPGVALGGYAWSLSKNFAATTKPVLKADASGYAPIDITCRAKGSGSIVFYDTRDRANKVDLLTAASVPPGGDWCG